MSVWSVSDVTQGIAGTLRKAAEATGAGFDYLVKTAQRESSMNPTAKAKTSSAAGMFQFTEQTWLQTVKENGSKYGLKDEVASIAKSANGRYSIADPKMREKILALRYDTETSALMAGEFTENNKSQMRAALRRPPSEGELYAAHFLGAQGAIDLIRLASAAPNSKAADKFPEAAAANRSIFYSRGKARSAAEVLTKITNKHDNAPTPGLPAEANAPLVAQGAASFFTNAAPTRVAAPPADGPVFYSMFSTGQRPPVSKSVQSLWADLPPQSSAAGKVARAHSLVNASDVKAPLDLSSFVTPGGARNRGAGNI
jgi:Transglycosylase SLT domain